MIRKTQLGTVFLGAAFLFTLISGALAEKRVALVIGNSGYENTPALANPVNDAQDLAEALNRLGFEVILERNLNKRSLELATSRFARAAQDADAALFFYAGHGIQHRGLNYLVPIDAKLDDEFNIHFELTRLDDVLFALDRARGVKILVLDACRNNPLIDRLNRTSTTRDLMVARGLAKIEATRGMVIVYSTQLNQIAVDGSGRNSPFAGALLREIDEPGLEIGTLFRRVAVDVNRVTKGRQLPELSISLIGEFYINNRDTDLRAWSKIRDSNDATQIDKFIADYPKSILVTDARRRLAAIDRQQKEVAENERAERMRQSREKAERDRIAREEAEKQEQERQEREQAYRRQLEKHHLAEQERAQQEAAAGAEKERNRSDTKQSAEVPSEARQQPPGAAPVTAMLAPSPEPPPSSARPSEPSPSNGALISGIKKELKRIGCYSGGIDERWTDGVTRSSIRRFSRIAGLSTAAREPSADLLKQLHEKPEGYCPLECDAGHVERDGQCIEKTCRHGYVLSEEGRCEKREVQSKTRSRPKRALREETSKAKREHVRVSPRPAERTKSRAAAPSSPKLQSSNRNSYDAKWIKCRQTVHGRANRFARIDACVRGGG